MQGYKELVDTLRQELHKARGALARDLAAAAAGADWQVFLRDRYDVAALVEHIEELGRKPDWVARLQAAGDRARQQGGKRGRPRKPASKPAGKPANRVAGPAAAPAGVAGAAG